jgi:hypothetical protein
VDVECDAVQQLTTIRIHLYCKQRSKTLARLPPEYLIGGFLRYVDQHYPLHNTSSPPVETVLVTTSLAIFYRILETVESCDSEQDRRLFHAHFGRWADLSCLLRRKMFGANAVVKAGTDAARLLAELATHMRLPATADPLCVIQNAFEQFFPLAPPQSSASPSSSPPDPHVGRRLENNEELERHLEPVGLSADSLSAYSPVLLHISLIKTVIEYAGKSFPSLGAISCMEARRRRRPALFLIKPNRPEGKVELNSAARAGFAVHSSRSPRSGRLRESLVWEDGSHTLLSEAAALQALMIVLKAAAEQCPNASSGTGGGGVLLIAARRDRSLGVLLAALARHDLLMSFRDIVKGQGSIFLLKMTIIMPSPRENKLISLKGTVSRKSAKKGHRAGAIE